VFDAFPVDAVEKGVAGDGGGTMDTSQSTGMFQSHQPEMDKPTS